MKVQDDAPLDNLLAAIATEGRWADDLFTGFQLYPYFDSSERTRKTLTAQSLASKIIGVLARGASITDLLNELSKQWTGINVFGGATAGQPGLIESLHKTLDDHAEGKKTVIDRIEKIRLHQEGAQLAFNGVQYAHSPVRAETKNVSYLRPLFGRIDNVDEQFISVRGMLCSVDAARQAGTYVGKMLEGSGVRWVLTDFPVFLLSHKLFKDGLMVIQIPNEILDRMETTLPFDTSIGWYPYVRVYGFCRRSFSPRHPFPTLACSWLEHRLPKPPGQLSDQLTKAYRGPTHVANAGFNVAVKEQAELMLFRDTMRILARSVNLHVDDLRPEQTELIRDADTRLAQHDAPNV